MRMRCDPHRATVRIRENAVGWTPHGPSIPDFTIAPSNRSRRHRPRGMLSRLRSECFDTSALDRYAVQAMKVSNISKEAVEVSLVVGKRSTEKKIALMLPEFRVDERA